MLLQMFLLIRGLVRFFQRRKQQRDINPDHPDSAGS
jgi:hypothetical protein